jgi:hypothetical protein
VDCLVVCVVEMPRTVQCRRLELGRVRDGALLRTVEPATPRRAVRTAEVVPISNGARGTLALSINCQFHLSTERNHYDVKPFVKLEIVVCLPW